MSIRVIAEAGVNHNGNLDMALALVDEAAKAGADYVKFQTFRASAIASAGAPKAPYQLAGTDAGESQLDMLKRLELDEAAHRALIKRCDERSIKFLSTPFDLGSLDLLTGPLRQKLIKLPSGEITNAPLLVAAGRSGADIILSTGMSTLEDVREALGALAYGFAGDRSLTPNRDTFHCALTSDAGKAALKSKVTVLHCTTDYPTRFQDVNLRAMVSMGTSFDIPVGYSDHTPGIAVSLAAAALGAKVIEKHFTLDRSLPGPDHKASLEPAELRALVEGVRAVEASLGDGVKLPTFSEMRNMSAARKCVVAARDIKQGERFTTDNLTVKRGNGRVSPFQYWDLQKFVASRAFAADEAIEG
jgi:N-acetylneuraminate synthase